MRGGDQFFELSTGYPYNPSSPLFPGNDFELVSPTGTVYTIDARLGITAQQVSSGETVYFGDSGAVAGGGDSIRFITDGEGRISRVVGPNGEILDYQYDGRGNLVAVRSPQSGQTDRYGYSATEPGLLEIALTGAGGSSFSYATNTQPRVHPIAGRLGAAATFSGQSRSAALTSGETARYAFSVRQSELDSTSTGEVLIRASVSTEAGLQVTAPQIAGLTPRTTSVNGDRAEAVYAVTREGLYQVIINEAGGTSGNFTLELMVAGDVDANGVVDGLDSDLQAALVGSQVGDANFNDRADVDGSGEITFDDRLLLFRNAGFAANSAPRAAADFATQLTHVDLMLQFPLTEAVIDPDGDDVVYEIVGAANGSVSLSPDGRIVTFVPDGGYSGPASIEVIADDGFNQSVPITLDINVSDAELLDIEIVNRQPQVGLGERATLVVLGDFADQQDVPLIGGYVTLVSSDVGIVEVDLDGSLRGLADGYAAVTVSRGFHADATAVTVGNPIDLERTDGVFVYPSSLTLPLVSGQRQFLVQTLDGEIDLSTAAEGTIYVIGDSRVIDVTADGLVTSSALGETTLTILSGPAEETIPIQVLEPEIGSATFGSEGGLLQGSDGTQLQIPPGALPDGVTVSLDAAPIPPQSELPAADQFTPAIAFNLDFGGHTLDVPAQLAIPVGSEFAEGDTIYFMKRESLLDIDGDIQEYWLIVETGLVGNDGFARTTSPPYPGFSAGGQYMAAKSDQPEKLVTIGGSPRAHEGFSLALDWNNGIGIHLGGGFLPIIPALVPVITVATYRRRPLDEIPVAQQTVNVSGATPGQVFTPAISLPFIDPADSSPVVTGLQLTSLDPATIELSGQRFAGSEVVFRYAGQEIVAGAVASDTSATVAVPAGVIAGLADIVVKHPTFGESNVSRLTSPGGLGAVGRTGGGIAVFDTNTNSNTLLATYDFGGGSDTIFTTDLTRLYSATFRHGIGVVDAITLKQLPSIQLPNNAFHHQITIDPQDRFLFVGSPGNTIYIVDIRPDSPTFHQTLSSIVLPRERRVATGIAVSADSSKLLVSTGTEYEEGYLTVFELDWDKAPTAANPNATQFATLLQDDDVGGIPHAITASTNPEYAAFTYRYRVSSYHPWGGGGGFQPNLLRFQAVHLTDNGYSTERVSTAHIGGRLSPFTQSFPYSGYYTSILTPRDVVIAPDLSAAYIADWELQLIQGYGGQRGDKVGVVSDPFGLANGPEFLGATTPIDFGCTTSVAVSADGERVFGAYGCLGEVLVMDTSALIATGQSRDVNQREVLPLDLDGTPLNPVVNPGVHITPLTTGGLVQGLSTQAGDFFDLKRFGSKQGLDLNRVILEYEVRTPLNVELETPVEITFRGIPQRGQGNPVTLGTITIHKDQIGSNGIIELTDGEAPEDALKSGMHGLVLDPAQIGFLADAMANKDFELIEAGADPGVAKLNREVDFAGYYQRASGQRGVLRTGSKTKDKVTIDTNNDMNWTSDGVHPEESKTFASPADILVVTADKKDKVDTLGDGDAKTSTPLVILTGLGPDSAWGGTGDDYIDLGRDTGEENFGTVDFNLAYGMGGDDELIGSDAVDVMFGDGFDLSVDDAISWAFDLKQGIISTPTAGIIPVGSGNDTLMGGDGFDFLIGGEGDDTLESGAGFGGFLMGDTFEWSAGGQINLKPLFDAAENFTIFNPSTVSLLAAELVNVGLDVADFLGLPEFKGSGNDTIKGGAILDFFYAGKGNDTIDASGSAAAIGWGGEGRDTITGGNWVSMIWGDDLIADATSSQACTDCNDDFDATAHSAVNLFIGGEGDDTINGGGIVDLIIGDGITAGFSDTVKWTNDLKEGKLKPPIEVTTTGKGNDTIDGDWANIGVDVIFGGEGNDTITGAGFLAGPGLKVTPEVSIAFADIFNKTKNNETPNKSDTEKARAKRKLLDLKGWEYVSSDTESDTITGVGPLDFIAGSKGPDTLNARGVVRLDRRQRWQRHDRRQADGRRVDRGRQRRRYDLRSQPESIARWPGGRDLR